MLNPKEVLFLVYIGSALCDITKGRFLRGCVFKHTLSENCCTETQSKTDLCPLLWSSLSGESHKLENTEVNFAQDY